MDKSIEAEVTAKKRKTGILISLLIIIVVGGGVFFLRKYVKPALSRAEIITAVAEIGDVQNTVSASGTVLPEFEEILTSPISASVREVLMEAGTKVKSGQSILTLDKSASETEFQKLGYQIESKANEIRKLKLDLEKSFYDIQSNNNIKELRINNFKDAVASAERLYKAGGGTKEDVERAELDLKVAVLEKQQLENEIKSKQQTMKIEIREAEIALTIQKNDQQALKRKLDLANVVASRDGVITWVNNNIGAVVKEGEIVARVANLSSYKISGSLSDSQLDALQLAMPVIIKINDQQLRGTVVNVSPSINNSIVSFDIQLEDKDSKLLRPNMKVDVYLVTQSHSGRIRVQNGPAFKGFGQQQIFIMKNGVARRRKIKTGLSNFDYVEILSGIKAGEEVITSDMSDYEHTDEVEIKN